MVGTVAIQAVGESIISILKQSMFGSLQVDFQSTCSSNVFFLYRRENSEQVLGQETVVHILKQTSAWHREEPQRKAAN